MKSFLSLSNQERVENTILIFAKKLRQFSRHKVGCRLGPKFGPTIIVIGKTHPTLVIESILQLEKRPILITFFGLSSFLLVLSLIFTSLEWRKLSITISVFNFVLLSGYICLFLGLSSTTFDVFEPLFAFRLQHHNYQRKCYSVTNIILAIFHNLWSITHG